MPVKTEQPETSDKGKVPNGAVPFLLIKFKSTTIRIAGGR
jgi:hypothetical protein